MRAMLDSYTCYERMKEKETENRDFRIRFIERKTNRVVIAIHGGNIEPGTSEIAEAIAGDKHSFYIFEGIRPAGNFKLHIKSTNFDEPCGLDMVKRAEKVLSIHGCRDEGCILYIGGRDIELRNKMLNELNEAGFTAREGRNSNREGISPRNICNRGASSKGVQMEISSGFRNKIYKGLYKKDRGMKTEFFYHFVSTVSKMFGFDTNNQMK